MDSLRTTLGSGYAVKGSIYPKPGDIVRVRLNAKEDLRGIVLGVGEMYRILVGISALLQCFYIEVHRSFVTVEDVTYRQRVDPSSSIALNSGPRAFGGDGL